MAKREVINCPMCKGSGLEAVQGHPDKTFYCERCKGTGRILAKAKP
jgi:uncharacterized protein YbaR (Trm112 family)